MPHLNVVINGKHETISLEDDSYNRGSVTAPTEWDCIIKVTISQDGDIIKRISSSYRTLVSGIHLLLRQSYKVRYKQMEINYNEFGCEITIQIYTNDTYHRKLSVNDGNGNLKQELMGVIFAKELKSKMMRQTDKGFFGMCTVSLQTIPYMYPMQRDLEDTDSNYDSISSCTGDQHHTEQIPREMIQEIIKEAYGVLEKEMEKLKSIKLSVKELSIENTNKIERICKENEETNDGMRLMVRKVDHIVDKTDLMEVYLHKQFRSIDEEMSSLKHHVLQAQRVCVRNTSDKFSENLTTNNYTENLVSKPITSFQKILQPRKSRYHKSNTSSLLDGPCARYSPPTPKLNRRPADDHSISARFSSSTNDDLLDRVQIFDLDSSNSTIEIKNIDQTVTGTLPEESDENTKSTVGNSDDARILPPEVQRTFESFLDTEIFEQSDSQGELNEGVLHVTEDVQDLLTPAGLEAVSDVINVITSALKVAESPHRRRGLDTVICIDTSSSIRKKEAYQMKSSIMHIVANIEDVAVTQYLEENVGIVTFGNNTQILHHLTTDYSAIYDSLEELEFRGSTPMLLGLLLSYIVLQKFGGPTFVSNYRIAPRILLFTDGRPTDDCYFQDDSIEYTRKNPQTLRQIETYADYLFTQGIQLYPVGVGQQVNFTFLETIAKIGGGKYYKMDDISYLANHFKYQFIAGKVIQKCQETERELEYRDVLENINIMKNFSLDLEEMDAVTKLIEDSRELSNEEYSGLPPFGTRIKLSARENGQSQEGTVVGHASIDMVKVLLDVGDIIYIKSSLIGSTYNLVRVLDYPRKLTPTDTFLPGVWVIRASKPNSEYYDTGSIFNVSESGRLKIRWHAEDCGILWTTDTADIHIHAACFDFISWMYRHIDEWKAFSFDESVQIENIIKTKGTHKTKILQLLNEQARIMFKDNTVRLLESDKTIQLQRKDNSEFTHYTQ